MVKPQFVGKISPFTGNLLFEILGNLKNYGIGRVVVRNSFQKKYPEISCYVIRKVVPFRETIGSGPDELVYGNVWAEEIFRGRKLEGLELLQEATFLPDWKLIPREDEQQYLNVQSKVECKILPREALLPPVLSLIAKQKNPHQNKEPTIQMSYDYDRSSYRHKFELSKHHNYRLAKEGEEPNYRLKVKIPEKFKVGIKY